MARVAALLAMLQIKLKKSDPCNDENYFSLLSGEKEYLLVSADGAEFRVTARELSYLAQQAMPWFDYPYGDPGTPEKTDDTGKVIQEKREAVRGYVSGMRDAMMLQEEYIAIPRSYHRGHPHTPRPYKGRGQGWGVKAFALPQVACNNLTWQQYRALQTIAPQLFAEGISDEQALELQAQFLAHILAPRSLALLDTSGGSIRIRPHYEYRYNAEQAERLARFWQKHLDPTLFHICFQCYQTALTYYAATYPLLFSGEEKKDAMRDALSGEVGTINTIMKYAGYAEQQQVYDSNLPFVLDILNTMTKEAKEIERMNSRIKKK